jgi:prepilin-type N-terminal cleavage/methylation domain-containing protein
MLVFGRNHGFTQPPQRGFTTLEMLIAMGVLGVILTVAAALLQSNQRVSDAQQARTNSLEDARQAASRMAETINQAAYIYPAGKRIQVIDGMTGRAAINEVTTGTDALALLISDGLNTSPRKYHGVVFYLAQRKKFLRDLPDLPSNRIAPWVLVEARTGIEGSGTGAITWERNTIPLLNWDATINEGVLVDGVVDHASSSIGSDLMRNESFSPSEGIDNVFLSGLRANPNPSKFAANALLLGLGFQISIRVSAVGQAATTTPSTVITGLGTARNVPRR